MSTTAAILIEVSAFIVGAAVGILYFIRLMKTGGDNRRFRRLLIWVAALTFFTYLFADFWVIGEISAWNINYFSTFVLSVFHSLELFVFQTHFFDNGYQEFFFGSGFGDGNVCAVYIFAVAFVLACVSSSALIIRSFSRKRDGTLWLEKQVKNDQTANTHIFLLGGEISTLLAQSIRDDKLCEGHQIVFVGYPDPYQNYVDLSIWEKISRLFFAPKEEKTGPFHAVVYSSIPISQASGKGICEQLGLPNLRAFLDDERCKVYLLGDNEEDNLRCADALVLDGCKADIFCHASRDGINQYYEETLNAKENIKLHLVDSSYLAVRGIRKNHPKYLPVNYVEIGKDKDGEGWVTSPFNAMILGFGEMGQEALGMVFENAAFSDKDFRKSPFSCVVLDRQMDRIRNAYRKNHPAMNNDEGITYRKMEVGGDNFWKMLREQINSLNYVVVCLGNDRLNLAMAIEIVKTAYNESKTHRKDFAVLVSFENPTDLIKETVNRYNDSDQYKDCIKPFGSRQEIWTYDNVTNNSIEAKARLFSYRYELAQGKSEEKAQSAWNERDKLLSGTDISVINNAIRCKAQDYANCLHMDTKLSLLGDDLKLRAKEIADNIPTLFDETKQPEKHYSIDDPYVEKTLKYLAVTEHLRWNASHYALGYTFGGKKDTVLKNHPCLVDFDKLDGGTRHYDYLVVKTTLELHELNKKEACTE